MIKKILSLMLVGMIFSLPIAFSAQIPQGTVDQVCGLEQPNPKDSLVGSAVSLCLPGILEKYKEKENIKCRAAKCYYNAVTSGLDPSFCTKQEQYETCVYIQGEVFSLPGLHFAEELREAVGDVLSNPAGYLYSFGVKRLRDYVDSACSKGGTSCQSVIVGISALGLAYNDIVSAKQLLEDMQENTPWKGYPDECEGLDEIEKEMQQILGQNA